MMDFSHPNAQPFDLGEGQDACLLIHGFTGSPGHMRPLGDALAGRGFAVKGILLPGHATRIEDMNNADWRQWKACAVEAARELKRKHRRVYAVGLSMGGILSLLLGQMREVDAVVSLSAPMKIHSAKGAAFSRVLWPFVPYLLDKPIAPDNFLSEYDFGYDSTPVRRVVDLTHLIRIAKKGLGDLQCPLLVVQSYQDESVRPVSADIIFANAATKKKEMLMLEKSPHVVTLGADREQVFQRVAAFLERQSEEQ